MLTGLKLTPEACRALFPGRLPGCLADAEGLLAERTACVRDLSPDPKYGIYRLLPEFHGRGG